MNTTSDQPIADKTELHRRAVEFLEAYPRNFRIRVADVEARLTELEAFLDKHTEGIREPKP